MHDAGCLRLVHWDDPEGWYGEGGGRRVQDGEHMYNFFKIKKKNKGLRKNKRRLLLGRKTMTNLDSILQSRDITLPTKVHLGRATLFPIVMYGCESWTVKKAEC